jgi:hypothetical protein
MEIDRGSLLEVMSYFLQTLAKIEEELAAHECLLLWSRRVPGTADAMDVLLEHARKSTSLPHHLQKKYDEYLEHIANGLVDALETQSGGQQLESLPNMVAGRSRSIN